MRFEHEGISIWYGTPDAPAPEGAVRAGANISIIVAVQPTDASNKVELRYSINQGPVETVDAKWLRNDLSHKAQYFKVYLPSFRVGDTVEYTALCRCAGRQVPSTEDAKQFVSSFQVVKAGSSPTPSPTINVAPGFTAERANGSSTGAISPKGEVVPQPLSHSSEPLSVSALEASRSNSTMNPVTQSPITMPRTTSMRLNSAMLDKSVLDHLNGNADSKVIMGETLNAALKSTLASALTDNGSTQLAELIQAMSPVDIAANKDVSVRAFVAKQIQDKVQSDAILKKAVDEEVRKLSDKTTIGDLLGLDKPIKDHPLFQDEVQKVALSSLLSTSSVAANTQLPEKFISLYAEHEGPIENFWSTLHEQPDFKAPGTVENIQFTLQLGVLTQNNLPLVQSLQGLRQQGTLQSPRDLTRLDADAWTKLINSPGSTIDIPPSVPGTTREEQVANYVSGILAVLHRAFPTSYVAQELARSPQIDLHLVRNLIALNPRLTRLILFPTRSIGQG